MTIKILQTALMKLLPQENKYSENISYVPLND